jgi:hypothetical protein
VFITCTVYKAEKLKKNVRTKEKPGKMCVDTVTHFDSLALHKVTEIRKLNSPYLETSKVLHQKTEVILPT